MVDVNEDSTSSRPIRNTRNQEGGTSCTSRIRRHFARRTPARGSKGRTDGRATRPLSGSMGVTCCVVGGATSRRGTLCKSDAVVPFTGAVRSSARPARGQR